MRKLYIYQNARCNNKKNSLVFSEKVGRKISQNTKAEYLSYCWISYLRFSHTLLYMLKAVSKLMSQTIPTEAFLHFPQFLQANMGITHRPVICSSFPINQSQITLPPTLYTQRYRSCVK